MAGKPLLSTEAKKRVVALRKTNKLTNPQIAEKVAQEFSLDRVPSLPTISKAISEGKKKPAKKAKTPTKGEQLLQEAQANPKPIVPPNPQNLVAPAPQAMQEESKQALVNNALDADIGSLGGIDNQALTNFMGGSDALGMLNNVVNESVAPQDSGNFMDDLLGAVPKTNNLEVMANDTSYQDMSNISNMNDQIATNGNYRNDDVTLRNQEGYQQKMSEKYEDTNAFVTANQVSTLRSGVGVTIENKAKLFIEKLMKANQIYGIGIIVNGAVYFPSFNIKYIYEVQRACGSRDGFMILANGMIQVVDEKVAEEYIKVNKAKFAHIFSSKKAVDQDQFVGYLFNSLKGIQKLITDEFTDFKSKYSNPVNIGYDGLVQMFLSDPNSTPYVSVINTVNTNKELQGVLEFTKINPSNVNSIIASITTHDVNVMCFK